MAKFNGFRGDYTGLTQTEAEKLQSQYGMNEFGSDKKQSFFEDS